MTLTRQALEERGFRIPPEGGLAVRVREGEVSIRKSDEKPEPLPQSVIDGIVAAFPLPTKDLRLCPRIIGCDPSINEAGFAEVGGPNGTVRTAEFRSKHEWGTDEKVLALARFAADFAARGLPPDIVIVEGTYFRRTGDASAEAIQVYGEAVGAVQGAMCIACPEATIIRVGPEWMPRILTGPNTLKEDRWGVAKGLLQRAGWEWPEGGSPHAWDAVALAVVRLAEGGWL